MPWLVQHGLDLPLLWEEIARSQVSAFAWADVLVTVLTILIFLHFDAPRAGVGRVFWPVLVALLVGASLALPLYLYLISTCANVRNSSRAPGPERLGPLAWAA